MKSPVSRKISKLVREGYPHKQAVAIALNMQSKGRLGHKGGYRRKSRKKSRRKSKKTSRRKSKKK